MKDDEPIKKSDLLNAEARAWERIERQIDGRTTKKKVAGTEKTKTGSLKG